MPANLIFLNPNSLFSASHRQMTTMKAFVLGSAATFGLALSIYAQTPAATPETSAPSPTLAGSAGSAGIALVARGCAGNGAPVVRLAPRHRARLDRRGCDYVFRNQCRLGQWRLGAWFDPRLDRSGYLLAWRLAYRDEKALKQ